MVTYGHIWPRARLRTSRVIGGAWPEGALIPFRLFGSMAGSLKVIVSLGTSLTPLPVWGPFFIEWYQAPNQLGGITHTTSVALHSILPLFASTLVFYPFTQVNRYGGP